MKALVLSAAVLLLAHGALGAGLMSEKQARGKAAQILSGVREVANRADDLLGFDEKAAARRRQCHSTGRTLEKRHPELLLERLDVAGQRRLAQVQGLGRPGQMAELGDLDEGAKMIEVHSRALETGTPAGPYCSAPFSDGAVKQMLTARDPQSDASIICCDAQYMVRRVEKRYA